LTQNQLSHLIDKHQCKKFLVAIVYAVQQVKGTYKLSHTKSLTFICTQFDSHYLNGDSKTCKILNRYSTL